MPEFSPRGNVGFVQKIALAEIYTMHSFAPFWNRIPKNEENRSLISIFSLKIAAFFADFYKIIMLQNLPEFAEFLLNCC